MIACICRCGHGLRRPWDEGCRRRRERTTSSTDIRPGHEQPFPRRHGQFATLSDQRAGSAVAGCDSSCGRLFEAIALFETWGSGCENDIPAVASASCAAEPHPGTRPPQTVRCCSGGGLRRRFGLLELAGAQLHPQSGATPSRGLNTLGHIEYSVTPPTLTLLEQWSQKVLVFSNGYTPARGP